MKDKMNKSMKVIMLPFILILLLSCATTPKIQSPLPTEEFRANLGTIGVVSGSLQPEVRFQKPMTKGAAALHGAEAGAGFVAQAGAGCNGVGCAGVLALIPVGAVIGSIVGAATGVSPGKSKETEDALRCHLATVNFQETMRERFLLIAREQTQYPFVLLELQGPNALDEEATYGSLPEKDIDTILEISVRKCELWGEKNRINPLLRLLMAVGIRLIRITDGQVLYGRNFVYDYGTTFSKFSEWGINNAQPFREELDRAFQYLATEIVKALSMIQTPHNPQSQEASSGEIGMIY